MIDYLAAIAAVGAAFYYGGWEWALPAALVIAGLMRRPFSYVSVLGAMGLGLVWLVLSRFADNRQFYFPYTLWCALQLGCLGGGRFSLGLIGGAGLILAVFTGVRVAQDVTTPILVKELIVAGIAILLAAPAERPGSFRRLIAAAFGSLIAYAGLAI